MTNKKLLILLILLLATSCLKQKPDNIDSLTYDPLSYQERLEACSKFKIDSALLHDDTLNFFKCSNWDENHRHLFAAIENISADSWNNMTGPINNAVITKKENRDNLFVAFKTIDSTGGLDALVNIVNSLNKQNFYSGLNSLATCWKDGNCREGRASDRSDLNIFLSIMNESSPVMNKVYILTRSILLQKEKDKEIVKEILKQFSSMQSLEENLVEVVDHFLGNGQNTSLSFEFLDRLSSKHVTSGYLKTVNQKSFDELKNYVLRSPGLSYKLTLVESLIEGKVECNQDITLNLSKRTSDLVVATKNETVEGNLDKYSSALADMKIADQLCPGVDGPYYHNVDKEYPVKLSELMMETLALLGDDTNFELAKNILKAIESEEPLKTIRYLNNPTIISIFNIVAKNREQVNAINNLLSQLHGEESWETVKRVEDALNELIKIVKKDERYRAISRVWNYFDKSEKQFFISFLLEHVKNYDSLYSITAFYYDVWSILKPEWETIVTSYTSKSEDSLLKMLFEISNQLKGEVVLEDFRSFFSKKNIFRILQALTQGLASSITVDRDLRLDEVEKEVSSFTNIKSIGPYVQEKINCLSEYTFSSSSLIGLASILSPACISTLSSFEDIKFTIKLSDLGSQIDRDALGLSDDTKEFGFLDRYGLFSANSLTHFLKLFVSKEGIFSLEDSSRVLNLFRRVVKNKDIQNAIETTSSLGLRQKLENDIKSVLSPIADSFLKVIQKESNSNIAELVMAYERWLNSEERTRIQAVQTVDLEYLSCNSIFKDKKTGLSCPDPKLLKETIRAIMNDLLRNVGADHTALELLTNIVHHGSDNYDELIKYFKNDKFLMSEILSMMTQLHFGVDHQKIEYFSDLSFEKNDLNMLNGYDSEMGARFLLVTEDFSVMEKVEAVTRNIRFDNNYLGTHFLNAIVANESYDDLVQKKWILLKMCTNLKFCGKWMSKTEVRLSENSVNFFKGLTEINSDKYKYSYAFRKFFSPFVLSSEPDLQTDALIKKRILGMNIEIPVLHSKKKLSDHNGRILTRLTMVSFFTNLSRYLEYLVRLHQTDVKSVLESERFREFDKNFLRGEDLKKLQSSVKQLLEFLRSESGDAQLERIISLVSNLDTESKQYLERSAVNFIEIFNQQGLTGLAIDILNNSIKDFDIEALEKFLSTKIGKRVSKEIYNFSEFLKFFNNDQRTNSVTSSLISQVLSKIEEASRSKDAESSMVLASNRIMGSINQSLKLGDALDLFLTAFDKAVETERSDISWSVAHLGQYVKNNNLKFVYLDFLNSERLCKDGVCFRNPHHLEFVKIAISVLLDEKKAIWKVLDEITKDFDDKYIEKVLINIKDTVEF